MSYTERRKKFWIDASGLCHYCGKTTKLECEVADDDFATLDHVIPKNRGGKGLPNNRVLACFRCNQDKRSMTAEEFKAKLKDRAYDLPVLVMNGLLPEVTTELTEAFLARQGKCWFCDQHTNLWWESVTNRTATLTHGRLSCFKCHRKHRCSKLYEVVYGEGCYHPDGKGYA